VLKKGKNASEKQKYGGNQRGRNCRRKGNRSLIHGNEGKEPSQVLGDNPKIGPRRKRKSGEIKLRGRGTTGYSTSFRRGKGNSAETRGERGDGSGLIVWGCKGGGGGENGHRPVIRKKIKEKNGPTEGGYKSCK